MIRNFKLALVSLVLACASPLALALDEVRPVDARGFIGLTGGYADPTNIDGRFAWGADAGMLLPSGLLGVAYYRQSNADVNGKDLMLQHYGLGADFSLAPYAGEWLAGFHGGLRAGVSGLHPVREANGAEKTDIEFSWGPALGYDLLALPGNLSIGLEAALLFTLAGQEVNTLYLNGNLRWWF